MIHSHPYHEIVLSIPGSDVFYAFQGSLYILHPGEMIFFPAGVYYSGRYTVIDIIFNRLVIQISAEIRDYVIHASGLINPGWQKSVVILSTNAVSALGLRGHLERVAQIPWIKRAYQETMLNHGPMKLQLFINQLMEEQHTRSPNLTGVLISRVVEYIQKHYTEPSLTVAPFAENISIGRECSSRAFKEYIMESVHGYINNLQMQHFYRDITAGHSILDACTNSDFVSYNSFLKPSRSLYGMIPIQYCVQLNSIEKRNLNTYNSQVRTDSFSPFSGSLQL